ncbi:hypothetical protein [Granulicella sp. S156]|uniref:hypothetical protein n=1 Tax=Granulicella sp. S156 TaxID=1747224 RepID=UPI00131D1A2E|nr:hypothetical protein [Granulicella sp. S156]
MNLAISAFHSTNNIGTAKAKVDGYVAKNFKDAKRIADLYGYLDEYAKWFATSGIISADSNVLLAYPLTSNWQLGGLISRVDYLQSGYRAVLFEGIAPGWEDQLRMPLIQTAIAVRYGRPATEVKVGFQELDGNTLTDTRYNIAQRSSAEDEFKKIGAQVWKLLPNLSP